MIVRWERSQRSLFGTCWPLVLLEIEGHSEEQERERCLI
ncbi:unnamed protein product [Brassica oleracea var. botrytis]